MKKPFKVLLYEPGNSGHRPVILRYLAEGLPQNGVDVVVNTDARYSDLSDASLAALTELAQSEGCDLVHLLTIDGALRRWLRPRKDWRRQLPIIGTYYKFSNLRGVAGLAWLMATAWGYYDRLLISDMFWARRLVVPGLRSKVSFVPDPWSRDDFPFYDRTEARRIVGLPENRKIFLVFGEISQRKGVSRILEALSIVRAQDILVVFAGRVQDDVKDDITAACANPILARRMAVIDRHVDESMVSPYFHAADAVICDYPRWFIVSSGTFTRALAAGRVSLIPNVGVNCECAANIGSSVIYSVENVRSLADSIDSCCASMPTLGPSVAIEAESRELKNFIKFTLNAYAQTT